MINPSTNRSNWRSVSGSDEKVLPSRERIIQLEIPILIIEPSVTQNETHLSNTRDALSNIASKCPLMIDLSNFDNLPFNLLGVLVHATAQSCDKDNLLFFCTPHAHATEVLNLIRLTKNITCDSASAAKSIRERLLEM